MDYLISHPSKKIKTRIHLPSSKSESNRALIINALSGNIGTIENISTARDTETMLKLLQSKDKILDVIDAGTTMRFLTSYLSLQNQERIITGTERMCERPIGLLVDALRTLGAEIEYRKNEGFPPLLIKGLKNQHTNQVSIRGDVSSQYISSLLMIGPCLPKGLILTLTGVVGSLPYIMMTLQMMRDFGINYTFENNTITIEPQNYKKTTFFVESDWSGASYWYSIAALSYEADIELVGLKNNSLQGDAVIASIMENFGVQTEFFDHYVRITKPFSHHLTEHISLDFAHCPDLAQTVAVCAAALNIRLEMTGIESLKVKETDRISALQYELSKYNVSIQETEKNQSYQVIGVPEYKSTQTIKTYKDHRMAMAFAPMAMKSSIKIENPEVVVKSYPSYWTDLKNAGFVIKEV
ncbi:MAG: 3-phosphoshikimate 1-carboxyvinyltransferase [Cytophagales bacterium]|nr:3-phosphoshikimate 1-carboxyvinyltransferase [Cytophagales bacterium]